MIHNKIYLLCLVFLLPVIQSITPDTYLNRRVHKNEDDIIDDVVTGSSKYQRLNDDSLQPSADRRNRYSAQGSSSNNYRSRSRGQQPSSSSLYDDDQSDSNDWSTYGYGPNNILSNFFGSLPSNSYDTGAYLSNGPTCHSLLDPIYPLFSDICGSVPQARYSLPNAFGHLERWQIAQVLTVLLGPSTPSSANPVCSRSIRLLVCPLLFPPCPTRYEAPPVLPCQPFCRVVKNQCASPSLDLLPCDLLPPTSDLCPINPTPYSSLLSPFGPPLSLNGPLSQLGLSQSTLSSLLAQSALSAGLSPMDLPPSVLSSLLSSSPFASGMAPPGVPSPALASFLSSSGMIPPGLSPQTLASLLSSSGMTPSGLPPQALASFLSSSGMQPTSMTPQGIPPQALASFLSSSRMQPSAFPPSAMSSMLSPINPFFNTDSFMAESTNPILVDFPPLQYLQGFPQPPRYFPQTRSATEKTKKIDNILKLITIIILLVIGCHGINVSISSSGAYIARCYIDLNDDIGILSLTSGKINAGETRNMELSENFRWLKIRCENQRFINIWGDIFTQEHNNPQTLCYQIDGTTLNPSYSVKNC